MFAQILGAFIAAAVIYANYRSAIDMYEGVGIRTVIGETSTAGIFCTYPAPFMTTIGEFFSSVFLQWLLILGEFVASGMLMFIIFAITDQDNIPAGNLTPLVLFFLIFGIGACLGWETGYAVSHNLIVKLD
jgi:aquaglyceroporin related protein